MTSVADLCKSHSMELGGDAEISHHLMVHVSQHLSINPLFTKHLHILAHANTLQQLLYLQHCQRIS